MTVRELIEEIIYIDTKYLDYEMKYFQEIKKGQEISVPINAIGISTDKEILLTEKCPLCDK